MTYAATSTSNKRNEIALAKVSLTIVLIFILCHSIKWIPNIYEVVRLSFMNKRKWPTWIESITHLAHFALGLNSSVNFYVYCIKHFGVCRKRDQSSSPNHGGGEITTMRTQLFQSEGSPLIKHTTLIVDARPQMMADSESTSGRYSQNTYV